MAKQQLFKKSKLLNREKLICLIITFSVFFIGLIPYLYVRGESSYIYSFFDIFFDFKRIPLDENGLFYSLVTSFFSDFCWGFAMPFLLYIITNGRLSKFFYIFATPVVGSMLEFFQYIDVIDGVGDIIDAAIYFIASFMGYMILKRGILNGKKQI